MGAVRDQFGGLRINSGALRTNSGDPRGARLRQETPPCSPVKAVPLLALHEQGKIT